MNFVPCVEWVPRGKAASNPEKLQLAPEELKRLVDETKELCKENNSLEDTDDNEDSFETDQEEDQENSSDVPDDENDDFNSRYNLDSYDNDDDQNPLFTINDLAVHVDNRDDEYLTDEESEGDLEEKENFVIKDSDNLLIVGHVEDSSSVLEIHVYNQDDDVFYVHHDIVLPSYPLALAWLDFHPSDDKPGNYVAVGDMSPVIKIWDLDIVDILEPDYTLGKISKKKKEKMIKKEEMKCHSDAVLSLSWNKQVRNLLASGSADSTVIVWDLEEAASLNKLSFHSNKVQALQWHPTESQFLLSGCTDGLLKLYDCRSDVESKSWKLDGEIEKVIWNINDSFQFFCSTDQGYIHSVDIRKDKICYSFQAHKEAVTGLDMSPLRPDILISASMDKTLKVWDLKDDFKMIKSLKLKVGSIYTAKVAPDHELTVAAGGNNASNSLKILNIFNEKKSSDEFEDIKIKREKEEILQTTINKRIIYESDSELKDTKIKNEKEELPKTTENKRRAYESNNNLEDLKVKNEKEESPKTIVNKRIVYESNNESESIKIKSEKKEHPTSSKRKIYESNESERIKIKNEKKEHPTSNKRKIYDTEENDRMNQYSSSEFNKCIQKKNYKKKNKI